MRILSMVLVAVVGCAGGGKSRSADENVETAARALGPELAAARPFTPPTVPTDGVVVIVQPAHAWRSVIFSDESLAVSRAVAAFLREKHPEWQVVEPDLFTELEGASKGGWSPGARWQCQRGASPHQLADQLYPHAYRAQVNGSCGQVDGDCALSVHVIRYGETQAETLGEWRVDVAARARADQWTQAVARLESYVPDTGNVLGGLLGSLAMADGPKVEIREVHADGLWASAPGADAFAPVQTDLDACWEPGWLSGSSDSFNLAVAADGRVSRCERSDSLYDAASPRHGCLCDAFSKARLVPGADDRRLQVRLMNDLDSVRTAKGWMQHVMFAAGNEVPGRLAEGLDDVRHGVARCLADTGGVQGAMLVHYTVAGDGASTAAWADSFQGIPVAAGDCVKQALMAARFPCTPDGNAATFTVGLRAYVTQGDGVLDRLR